MSQNQFERSGSRSESVDPEQARAHQDQQTEDSSFEDLLDQIDAVIEQNPEGYVRGFVQRGGQ